MDNKVALRWSTGKEPSWDHRLEVVPKYPLSLLLGRSSGKETSVGEERTPKGSQDQLPFSKLRLA
uniref:Uncharacterized protein n=1 Tax=viral metagenome TaxID=1070528 RepID=A0A6M3KYF7_9ZZZZ